MPKVISLPKNLKRFNAAGEFTLILLQGFTFGVYNTRLKLKGRGYKFRSTDIVPILILGELKKAGCKVSDLANVLGFKNSVAQKVLNRLKNKGLADQEGGKRGRGHAARWYLSDMGFEIYETLQGEMGQSFADARQAFIRNILKRLNRV